MTFEWSPKRNKEVSHEDMEEENSIKRTPAKNTFSYTYIHEKMAKWSGIKLYDEIRQVIWGWRMLIDPRLLS